VVNRRASIEAERRDADPDVGDAEPALACFVPRGTAMGTFDTTWGTLDGMNFSSPATLELVIDGEPLMFDSYGAAAGVGDQGPTLILLGVQPGGRTWVVSLSPPRTFFTPGTINLDVIGVTGFVGTLEAGGFELAGFLGGEITFSEADTNAGDPVVGTLSGSLFAGF
jgi:hypothetical protein